ncbi:FecR domain-containing protein [Spirosoma sp. SC4-14]|uniref:FecR family protein n=1 Tax=Spirosoma sp. SC4-14 TaxID=3128900 RepID=UPI0030D22130
MPYNYYTVADFVLDESFQAYVLCTNPEAVAHWTAWLTQHSDREQDIRQAAELIRLLTGPKGERSVPNKEAELRRLIEQLPPARYPPLPPRRNHPAFIAHRFRSGMRTIAAVLAVLVFVGLGWFGYQQYRQSGLVVVHTNYGQHRTLYLPDGSQVVLNANSSLRYEPDWPEGKNRQVWLEGEAFFHVSKRQAAGRPVKFTVLAGELAVEVLGTQFNVFHRAEKTQVVLEEGRVRLRSVENSKSQLDLDMSPGETVVFSEANRVLSRQRVNPELYNAWRSNQLIFDNTPLWEVAERIQNTYGKTVTFADPELMNRRLSGTIPSDDLNRLIKALSRAFGLRITEQNDTLRIESN